ncbi:MAG: VUT family protein [Desulfarculales bacterium]|jgi:uncharacterized PurR-regulated membrane protein YhhQ (DUF165 family)|nr:VUT family protein [Desulfarculales bacterium]
MPYALLYIANVVLVNWAFAYAPVYVLPGGGVWPPVSLLVGFTFVIRDYAQRKIGHLVLPAMLLGGIISWYMATPEIAAASMAAFLSSELIDWGLYTFSGKPFYKRILLSSAVSTPIDSLIFLGLIDMFSPLTFLSMTISKMVSAFIIYSIARRREEGPLC